jgi:hypothetical protein
MITCFLVNTITGADNFPVVVILQLPLIRNRVLVTREEDPFRLPGITPGNRIIHDVWKKRSRSS